MIDFLCKGTPFLVIFQIYVDLIEERKARKVGFSAGGSPIFLYMTPQMSLLLDQDFLAVPYVNTLLRFAQALTGEIVDSVGRVGRGGQIRDSVWVVVEAYP